MRFMGSKRRLAKHLLPIILKDRRPNQYYVEPFVGGGNMIDKVDGLRIGADINPFLMQALRLIRDEPETLPKDVSEFTEQDYNDLKKAETGRLKGYIGFTISFAGIWFSCWSRDKQNSDYVRRAYNAAQKQSPGLQGVSLMTTSYQSLVIPARSIIYCDPPYAGTTGYQNKLDHAAFWKWCQEKTEQGHTVFVSEYTAPEGWVAVWEKVVGVGVSQKTVGKKGTEKLFVYEG